MDGSLHGGTDAPVATMLRAGEGVDDPHLHTPAAIAADESPTGPGPGPVGYQQIVEAAGEGIWLLDTQGRTLYANRRVAAMLGCDQTNLQARSWLDFVGPRGQACARKRLAEIRSGECVSLELELLRSDGSECWVIFSSSPARDAEGRHAGTIAILTDITERRRAEEKLYRLVNINERKKAEERLQQMTQRRELLVHTAGELLASSEPQEIVHTLCQQLIAHLDCHVFFNYLVDEKQQGLRLNAYGGVGEALATPAQWLEFGATVSGCVARDGCRIIAENIPATSDVRMDRLRSLGIQAYACHPLTVQGRLIGTLSFGSRSRTHFSEDDLALMRAVGDQVALAVERQRLLHAAEQRAAEAAQASQAKDQFLAILSHELRTPLAPVLLSTSLLEGRSDLPADVQADLQTIRQNVELEARIIDDLLDLTRVARGKMQFHMRPTDLHQLVRSAVEICGHGDGAPMTLDLQATCHCVHGDPTRLQQIFWNLLNNARKFTPAGGSITIRSRDGDDDGNGNGRIRVEVHDTGIGIDPGFLPRMFSAFEQSQESRRRNHGGLGLGLAISKAIAEAHAGTLAVHSAGKGRGATFTVELPTVCAWPQQPPRGPAAEAATTTRAALRVLLVEDHPGTLKVMRRLIESLGHQVRTADSVGAALQAAQEGQYDLVVSDIGLPDGSGLDVMRQLRQRSGIKGIALSGYGMEDDLRRSREAGFAEHLIKPVDFKQLKATIARVAAT